MRIGREDHPAWVHWRIVGLLMAIGFLDYFNRISMPVAGERIMAEYAISETRMGWVYSALLIAYTACMLPGGWFSDRFGARVALTTMGLGTALFVALTGLVGLMPAAFLVFPALLAVRGLLGAFTAPLYPGAGRAVAHWMPLRRRALANGLVTGAAMSGMAFAHPLFARLIGACGWRSAFLVTGTVTAAVAVLWACYGRDAPRGHPSVDRDERGSGAGKRR